MNLENSIVNLNNFTFIEDLDANIRIFGLHLLQNSTAQYIAVTVTALLTLKAELSPTYNL